MKDGEMISQKNICICKQQCSEGEKDGEVGGWVEVGKGGENGNIYNSVFSNSKVKKLYCNSFMQFIVYTELCFGNLWPFVIYL